MGSGGRPGIVLKVAAKTETEVIFAASEEEVEYFTIGSDYHITAVATAHGGKHGGGEDEGRAS